MWTISEKDRAGVARSFSRVRQLWYLKLTTPVHLVSYLEWVELFAHHLLCLNGMQGWQLYPLFPLLAGLKCTFLTGQRCLPSCYASESTNGLSNVFRNMKDRQVIRDTEFKAAFNVHVGSHDSHVLCHRVLNVCMCERGRECVCVCVCVCVRERKRVCVCVYSMWKINVIKSDLMTHNSSCTSKQTQQPQLLFIIRCIPFVFLDMFVL
jgi:hypothetical protein